MHVRIERYESDSVEKANGFEGWIEPQPEGARSGWIIYFRPDGSAQAFRRDSTGTVIGDVVEFPAQVDDDAAVSAMAEKLARLRTCYENLPSGEPGATIHAAVISGMGHVKELARRLANSTSSSDVRTRAWAVFYEAAALSG